MTYRHGDDWAVGMVGGSAVRAEAMNIMHRLAKIVLSLVLTMGLVPLVPDRALADGGLDRGADDSRTL